MYTGLEQPEGKCRQYYNFWTNYPFNGHIKVLTMALVINKTFLMLPPYTYCLPRLHERLLHL